MKDPQKKLREQTWKRAPGMDGPVHNPVKEGMRKGFNFVKLFWAVILLGIITWFLYTYGEDLGLVTF